MFPTHPDHIDHPPCAQHSSKERRNELEKRSLAGRRGGEDPGVRWPQRGRHRKRAGNCGPGGAEGLGTSGGSRVSRAEELMGAEPSRQRTPREKRRAVTGLGRG